MREFLSSVSFTNTYIHVRLLKEMIISLTKEVGSFSGKQFREIALLFIEISPDMGEIYISISQF